MNSIAFYIRQSWRVLADRIRTRPEGFWAVVLFAAFSQSNAIAESSEAFIELPKALEIELALSAVWRCLASDRERRRTLLDALGSSLTVLPWLPLTLLIL